MNTGATLEGRARLGEVSACNLLTSAPASREITIHDLLRRTVAVHERWQCANPAAPASQ